MDDDPAPCYTTIKYKTRRITEIIRTSNYQHVQNNGYANGRTKLHY